MIIPTEFNIINLNYLSDIKSHFLIIDISGLVVDIDYLITRLDNYFTEQNNPSEKQSSNGHIRMKTPFRQ